MREGEKNDVNEEYSKESNMRKLEGEKQMIKKNKRKGVMKGE